MSGFVLTDRHLREGLTDADFSAYAGIPVASFRLSDFPHWSTLLSQGFLPAEQLKERADAIFAATRAPNALNERHDPSFFSEERAAKIAGQLSPSVYVNTTLLPQDVSEKIWSLPMNVHGTVDGLPFVFPRPREGSPIQLRRSSAAFVFREGFELSHNTWSVRTQVPARKLAKGSDDFLARLYADLHEMRHLIQLHTKTEMMGAGNGIRDEDKDEDKVLSFYNEADADAAADRCFAENGIKPDAVVSARHARYISILLGSAEKNWTAPVTEAYAAGTEPPAYQAVCDAVREIKANLVIHINRIPAAYFAALSMEKHSNSTPGNSIFTSKDVVDRLATDFDRWSKEQCLGMPERILSPLRQRTEGAGFAAPLANHIAMKILEAADHFNPALSRDPQPVAPFLVNLTQSSGPTFQTMAGPH